jgi:hypothetical protein
MPKKTKGPDTSRGPFILPFKPQIKAEKYSHEKAQKTQRKINHRFHGLTQIYFTAENAESTEF